MDKKTFSNYGWIICVVVVISIMMALATPFGGFITNGVKSVLSSTYSTMTDSLRPEESLSPETPDDADGVDEYTFYLDADDIEAALVRIFTKNYTSNFAATNNGDHVSFTVEDNEDYEQTIDLQFNADGEVTGRYVTFEYRLSAGAPALFLYVEDSAGGCIEDAEIELVADGEKHTITIDLLALNEEFGGDITIEETSGECSICIFAFENYGDEEAVVEFFDIFYIGFSIEDPNS